MSELTFASSDEALQHLANVTGKKIMVADRGTEYDKYFSEMLQKYNVDSPQELDAARKVQFFDEVDKGWVSREEEKTSK